MLPLYHNVHQRYSTLSNKLCRLGGSEYVEVNATDLTTLCCQKHIYVDVLNNICWDYAK